MTCRVIIPIKALDKCKTRLRAVLSDADLNALVREMLANVVQAAQRARGVDRVALLGSGDHDVTIDVVPDDGNDLNSALQILLQRTEASRLIVLPADLPRITSVDIEALANVQGTAIAPDRAGLGTNALSLPLPSARAFQFQFGEGSFARHKIEAARLNLPLQIIQSAALALDIDTPADLEILRATV